MALTPGTKLGPYEIQESLGAGGMGEVYRARDTRLQRTVAIKILPQILSSDQERLERFQQEARILSAPNHPNLMAIYDVGAQDGIHFLVSEFLDGQSLRDVFSNGPLPQRNPRQQDQAADGDGHPAQLQPEMAGDALVQDIPRAKTEPGPHHQRQAQPEAGQAEVKARQARRRAAASHRPGSPFAAREERCPIR